MRRSGRRARAEEGFALIAVLLVVAILSIIATSMISSGRISAELSHYSAEETRATAALEAGIDLAALGLLDPRPDHQWRLDGVARTVSIFGQTVTVSIQDELGKIDLNEAPPDLLKGLLLLAGLDSRNADTMVDRILDWRGIPGLKHLNGFSEADYASMNLSYRPRRAPFQRVDELLLVPGMTPALYRRVLPAITVYSGKAVFDPNVAPPAALLALSNMDKARVDEIMRARMAATGNTTGAPLSSSDGMGSMTAMEGRAFSIHAEIVEPDGVHYHLAEVLRLTGDNRRPFWVLLRDAS